MFDFLVKNGENLLQTAILVLAILVVRFLIGATGLFLISKKRYAKRPFMAFIPILSPYALGASADRANIKRGKKTNSANTLLLLSIFKTVAYIAFLVVTFLSFKEIVSVVNEATANGNQLSSEILKPAIFMVATYLIALILAVIYAVYYFIALFRVYKREVNTALAVVLLILSLFVSPAKEIILFVLGLTVKEEIGFTIE